MPAVMYVRVCLCMGSKHGAEQCTAMSLRGRRGLLTVQLCQCLLERPSGNLPVCVRVIVCRCVCSTVATSEITEGDVVRSSSKLNCREKFKIHLY